MTELVPIRKFGDDEFQFEIEVLTPLKPEDFKDSEDYEIALEVQNLDQQLDVIKTEIEKLNVEIDKLTNHADGLDYAISVASGVLTGLIDSFFVGKYDVDIDIKDIVTKFASKKSGEDMDSYEEARVWLEDNAQVDHDGAYQPTKEQRKRKENRKDIFGRDVKSNGHTHRLDDLAHHPTLVGLAASIFFQFFRVAFFVNKEGKIRPTFVKTDIKKLAKIWAPAVLSGIMLWLANVAEKYVEEDLDEEIPAPIKKLIKLIAATPMIITILKCADRWYMHIMSDVGPTEDGKSGKGIPGIFLSLLKELSMIIPSAKLHTAIQDLYNSGTMNFDKELVVIENLKKQAMPVIINEVIVRSFYFVRRLILEYQEHGNFVDVDWQKIVPFGNRTVERMMTISSTTFMTVDLIDAAIRGAAKSGGNPALFATEAILHVNFVNVGRVAIAIVTDVGMGIKRNKLRNERLALYSEMLNLSNAKIFYMEAGMWKTAIDTQKVLNETWDVAEKSIQAFSLSWTQIEDDMIEIHDDINKVTDDSDFSQELLDILTIG